MTRRDGFAPIGDYAVLGNGRTVALVATDGRIDWLPTPALHTPPVFAALLDPGHGGHLELVPSVPFTSEHRYRAGSPVLETTYTTDVGRVRVVDALTVGVPWTELVRQIEGIAGEVPMTWAVRPGTRLGSAQPWIQRVGDAIIAHCGDQHIAVRHFDVGSPNLTANTVTGRFIIAAGGRAMLALAVSDDAPVYLPSRDDLDRRLDETSQRWQRWSSALTYHGRWADAVRRSALMLKLLQYEPSGALAAAATTSLPERIGGDKNWDYRFMWVRDAAFTIDALIRLGLHGEVQSALAFLLRSARSTAPDLNVFYTLDGAVPGSEAQLDVPGYRSSQPVRSGNGAATQIQLGTFGDLFDAVWRYVQAGHVLDPPTGRLLADLADRCCDLWRRPDAGIWELHVERHYTQSKMGCWVALDRASQLSERGQIPVTHAHRWRRERDLIHAWVHEHCWAPRKQSYTFYAGTDGLDAATLLAGANGFDRGPRLAGTITAVRRELGRGALVYRYSGMVAEEGTFLACSFWLASALACLGRHDEAAEQMDATLRTVGDRGLLAEQMDPETYAMLGNVPQALSHLALVNAAFLIERQ